MSKFMKKAILICALVLPLGAINANAATQNEEIFASPSQGVQLVAALDTAGRNNSVVSAGTAESKASFVDTQASESHMLSFSSAIWLFIVALFAFVSLSNRDKV
ncbi:hypothetical protein MTYP_00856 [Methylophilaceae bacterium]|nr:hypothetical protein MTYP_00856 [Methylophilaceae bacterium]